MATSPAFYCGMRPACEALVDNVGFPCLALGCTQKLVASCAGPLLLSCDKLTGAEARAALPHGGPQEAVCVATWRTARDFQAFADHFSAYAEKLQASTPGLRALFAFRDKDATSQNGVFIFAWCDTAEVLAAVAPTAFAAAGRYLLPGGTGAVFGNRSEAVRAALASTGFEYQIGSLPRGMVRSPPAEGFRDYGGPPMIWVSKRFVQPGAMAANASAFAKMIGIQYYAAPAMLASHEYSSADDPDQLWSLRFFNDFEMGFVAHFPKTACSCIPVRGALTVLPTLRGGFGAKFPVAVSVSTKSDVDAAVKANPGNAVYTQYFWEDVIGPLPDMSKKAPPGAASMDR